MVQSIFQTKPLNKSTDWKKFQKLIPIWIAAKQDDIFIIEEDYRDKIEPWFKGAVTSWRIRQYKFINGVWHHLNMSVFADTPDLEEHTHFFTGKGYNITQRQALREEEAMKTFSNAYAKVTIDEFYLCDQNQHLELSCYYPISLLQTAFCTSIDTNRLEMILEHMNLISVGSDDQIIDGELEFDNIYDYWETKDFTEQQKRLMLYWHLKLEK